MIKKTNNNKKIRTKSKKDKQIEVLLWKIREFDMKIKEERENKKQKKRP